MEEAGVLRLARDVRQGGAVGCQVEIAPDVVDVQRRAFVEIDGRQLCIVTDQQQLASMPLEDEGEEVVHQAAAAKKKRLSGAVSNHGSLIHNENGMAVLVRASGELPDTVLLTCPVNALVDGVCLLTRID